MKQNCILEKVDESYRLFEVIEDEAIFSPVKSVNQGLEHGNFMEIERISDDEDGTFPRISDYTRLANRMERDGTSEWLTWISKKLIADIGYCKIIRESKYDTKSTLTFKNPILVKIGEVNNEPITQKVNRIVGEFTHEWFWMKNGRQDKIANGFDIWFDCKEYFLD